MKKIVIFASGSGSNAENIIKYFKESTQAQVVAVFSNNSNAQVLDRANRLDVDTFVFTKAELNEGVVFQKVKEMNPDLIVLAGFLWKFPDDLIHQYPNKVINVHPALLPKYGGKGMYGMNVHRTVLENREKETGITIHYVNEHYDEGAIIFQTAVDIESCTTPEEVAQKVHQLEHEHFPLIIENLLTAYS